MKKNLIYQMIFQFISLFAPFITTPYVSRVLNAELIGQYNYVLSYVTYFILFASMGLATYGQREIAYAGENRDFRTKIFAELLFLRSISFTFILVLYICLFCLKGDNLWLNRLFVLHILSSFLDISWLFQGVEDFKRIVVRGTCVKFSGVILTFLFVNDVGDLLVYATVILVTNLIGNLILWRYVTVYIDFMKLFSYFHFKREHLVQALQLFIPQMSIQIYAVLDKTILGYMQGNIEVGYYSQAERVVKIAITVLTAAGTVLMPRIARLNADGNRGKIKKQAQVMLELVLVLAIPMTIGMYCIAGEFIPFFLGRGYEPSIKIMRILSILCISMGIASVTGPAILVAQKRNVQYTLSVLAGACTNLFLNLLLIPLYASVGAAIATVCAECIVTLLQVFFVKDTLNIKWIFQKLIRGLTLSVPMIVVVVILKRQFTWNNYMCIWLILIGACTYIGTICVIYKKEFITYLRNMRKQK